MPNDNDLILEIIKEVKEDVKDIKCNMVTKEVCNLKCTVINKRATIISSSITGAIGIIILIIKTIT